MFDRIVRRLRRRALLRAALSARLTALRFGAGAAVFDAMSEAVRRP